MSSTPLCELALRYALRDALRAGMAPEQLQHVVSQELGLEDAAIAYEQAKGGTVRLAFGSTPPPSLPVSAGPASIRQDSRSRSKRKASGKRPIKRMRE